VLAAVALILLFAFSLSWVWTAVALLVRTPHTVNVVGLVFLFPLTFTSNAFVDPRTMPGWLQTFIDLNPVSHLVTAARALIHGTSAGAELGWVLGACAVLIAIFAPITGHLYRRKN
jgi:ABC-2 type transport system permease protein